MKNSRGIRFAQDQNVYIYPENQLQWQSLKKSNSVQDAQGVTPTLTQTTLKNCGFLKRCDRGFTCVKGKCRPYRSTYMHSYFLLFIFLIKKMNQSLYRTIIF